VSTTSPFILPVQIYYEDTDHSGLVYHANYLKYFERAREHVLGADLLVRMLNEEGIGFVVYKCELTYNQGAVFGDILEIRTTPRLESEYRVVFQQDAYRRNELLVQGILQLVCVNNDKKLVPVPKSVIARVTGAGA
jgi:acyl-CoA thioester hydrolase